MQPYTRRGDDLLRSPRAEWLPWNPKNSTGYYLITGGTWESEKYGEMGTMNFQTYAYWNGEWFSSSDGDTYYPEFYLANIPEVPTCNK